MCCLFLNLSKNSQNQNPCFTLVVMKLQKLAKRCHSISDCLLPLLNVPIYLGHMYSDNLEFFPGNWCPMAFGIYLSISLLLYIGAIINKMSNILWYIVSPFDDCCDSYIPSQNILAICPHRSVWTKSENVLFFFFSFFSKHNNWHKSPVLLFFFFFFKF